MATTSAWISQLQRWAPVVRIYQELVRFDIQTMQDREISGVEYRQGTLSGYELRDCLLEK